MDCTYKTNKFEMPLFNIVGKTSTNAHFSVGFCFLKNELEESYVWALNQVKLLYEEGYTPKDVDPFWQQLSFRETIIDRDFGGTSGDTEIGRDLSEKYASLSRGQIQIWLSNLRDFIYPQFRFDIKEPPKGKSKGRPPTKTKSYVRNKTARELAEESKKKDPSGYEWLRKEYETWDEMEEDDIQGRNKRKIGQAEPSRRNVQEKCIELPTQESSTSKIDVKGKGLVSSQASSIKKLVGKVGLKQLARNNGNSLMVENIPSSGEKETLRIKRVPKPPPRDENGRYIRNYYILYESNLIFFPDYIRDYIKATDDVHGDENCGYHVFVDQLGPFEDAKGWGCDQVNYVKKKCLMELRGHCDFYKPMMRVERDETDEVLNESFEGMERWLNGNICLTSEYWMSMPICGQLLANAFNCVIHLISRYMSHTFAPTRIPFDEDLSTTKTVVMGHVQGSHYIGLRLQ
ncbi:uncharacterized protein LOC113306010 [Papaver somniferum]|uniref:uncharacterized protein LOC113306010 n=1 Tax=Papaver somniferum TaxID=3469 RepID=UPI000E6F9A32|nr:uncharacterized protein LOC113306010 [Papaver somniferum]